MTAGKIMPLAIFCFFSDPVLIYNIKNRYVQQSKIAIGQNFTGFKYEKVSI